MRRLTYLPDKDNKPFILKLALCMTIVFAVIIAVNNARHDKMYNEMFKQQTSIEELLMKSMDAQKKEVSLLKKENDTLLEKIVVYEKEIAKLSEKVKEKEVTTEDRKAELVQSPNPYVEEKNVLKYGLVHDVNKFKPKKVVGDNAILSTSKTYDVDKVRQVLEKIAPNLVGIEDELLYQYEKTGIKPEIIFGIASIESGKGTSNLARTKNNLTGWRAFPTATKTVYENAATFRTKGECIIITAQTIYNGYILRGVNTLPAIARIYCAAGSEKETIWANSVSKFSQEFVSTYNSL